MVKDMPRLIKINRECTDKTDILNKNYFYYIILIW